MPRAPVAYQQTPSRSHHQTPSRSHHQTLRQKPPPLQQSTQHNQAPYRRPAPRPPVSTQPQKYLQRPGSQLSNCTGKKKALCIGINYKGQARPLRGCINDVKNVKIFLTRYWGYRDGDIVMLIDDTENPRQMPTRQNILDGMAWLVKGAKPHDSLFFHYSGHGGQTPDKDGDEVDGYDQVIYPVDHKRAGFILDDEMHRIMVKSLPPHCRLTAVFDSCHSGTALDLPYIYHSNGRLKGSHVTSQARAYKSTQADVVSWCGCRDDQTSADTFQGGVAVGAMSYAFATSLSRNPNQSYQELLRSIREILKSRYSQKPQLSSSHPIDTNLRFIL
ncbi:hypothetical protein SERLADRAFT_402216 [Serpula lacrymans var. lacrymans S7.9]|uniref:Peptidase C14 caspase domain-containing protein n=1 Tax=Serpula lacrymans var. lacrymans (strain S7.9) TaxID=578457 RepID=F8PBK3_SERL9|nr:uncharacterized protein SERLADRAFT_402216 [Serpula lacrymans var. lacrymans S7.9]EGO19641.1 hypothetical protein SERLADRAFT_402216 [Serpula lacrymans var. lacrymans S7.9]